MIKHYLSAIHRKQPPRFFKKQSGSAIVLAIFMIIVISLLGASLISLQRDSAQGTSYEVYAARAYLSAYSASEIALMQLFPLDQVSGAESTCTVVTSNPVLPNNSSFQACSVDVNCTPIVASAGIATSYRVVSTATCANSQISTRRQITVEAVNL